MEAVEAGAPDPAGTVGGDGIGEEHLDSVVVIAEPAHLDAQLAGGPSVGLQQNEPLGDVGMGLRAVLRSRDLQLSARDRRLGTGGRVADAHGRECAAQPREPP